MYKVCIIRDKIITEKIKDKVETNLYRSYEDARNDIMIMARNRAQRAQEQLESRGKKDNDVIMGGVNQFGYANNQYEDDKSDKNALTDKPQYDINGIPLGPQLGDFIQGAIQAFMKGSKGGGKGGNIPWNTGKVNMDRVRDPQMDRNS